MYVYMYIEWIGLALEYNVNILEICEGIFWGCLIESKIIDIHIILFEFNIEEYAIWVDIKHNNIDSEVTIELGCWVMYTWLFDIGVIICLASIKHWVGRVFFEGVFE